MAAEADIRALTNAPKAHFARVAAKAQASPAKTAPDNSHGIASGHMGSPLSQFSLWENQPTATSKQPASTA